MVYADAMEAVNRRWTVRLYPSRRQLVAMQEASDRHCELYNAALEHRIGAWRRHKVSVSHREQANLLKDVKIDRPEYGLITHDTLNGTLKRLELAMKAFFRRVKARQTPGFPRFKSRKRFAGWQYLAHGKGNRLYPTNAVVDNVPIWRNGHLYLQHFGRMRFCGRTPHCGVIRTLTIRQQAGRWYASIVVRCVPSRQRGTRFVGMDWGVNDYATLAFADGETQTIANDRLFRAQQEKAAARQRHASKSLRGKRSRRAAAKHLKIARVHAKLANQRKDRCHKATAKLVASCRFIATEKLQVANMTRSAKGTVDQPGKNVAQKAGLNREILDTAPGQLSRQIRYKAEEAGCVFVEVNPRRHKPSQTCPQCDAVVKKTLAERQHRCGCGYEATRDGAAALVILMRALDDYGRKPAGGDAPENSTQNGAAVWVE